MSKSTNFWNIKINIDGNEQESLKLEDANKVLGEYIAINRNYFDDLLESLKISKNYNVGKVIEEITGTDGKNWTKNPWLLLMAKDTEKNAPFWFLIKRENDLNGFLVAIGPELLSNYLKSSKENIEEVRKILEYIVVYNNKWTATIFIPTILEDREPIH